VTEVEAGVILVAQWRKPIDHGPPASDQPANDSGLQLKGMACSHIKTMNVSRSGGSTNSANTLIEIA
jgi:hypothetical protein